jgi:excisionase family DNA binding protein
MGEPKTLKRADAESYLTVDEAAKELGLKTTVVRNYLYEGKLPAYKFKTLTLLKADDVEAWKDRQKPR